MGVGIGAGFLLVVINPPLHDMTEKLKSYYCCKVGLTVGMTVCLLRRRKVAKKKEEKKNEEGEEEGAAETDMGMGISLADMGNFERISLA